MSVLHWLHSDCLSADWITPAGAPAVFVFDPAQIEHEQWGLKRVMFLYECLLDLPVCIRKGPLIETLLGQMRVDRAESMVTVATPDPWLLRQIERLSRQTRLTVLPAPEFVSLREPVDLKRFTRYWKKAEPLLFR